MYLAFYDPWESISNAFRIFIWSWYLFADYFVRLENEQKEKKERRI